MNTYVGCSYPACVMFFVIRYPSRSYRASRCGNCNRTPSRTPAAPVLRARCSTLSRRAVPIPLRRKCGRYGEAPEIQKSVDGFVESEPHGNIAGDGHDRPTARQPPAHGVDRFFVRARGWIEKPFVLGKRGPEEVQNRSRIRAGGLPDGYSPKLVQFPALRR